MDKYLYYKNFCIRFCNYSIKQIQSDKSLSESDVSFCIEPLERQINDVNEWYNNGKRGLLDKVYRMDSQLALDYPDFLIENQKYFMDEYGVNILELDKKKQDRIARILERGKIKTDNDFRLIYEYVDELCQTEGNSELIDKLNALLLDYEKLVEIRLKKNRK